MQVTAGTDEAVCCVRERSVNRASRHERPDWEAPSGAAPGPRGLETMRFEPRSGVLRLEAHIARLARSCAYLGHAFSPSEARAALALACKGRSAACRVRLQVEPDGRARIDVTPLEEAEPPTYLPPPHPPLPEPPMGEVALAIERVDERWPLLRHKTTARTLYDAASRVARASGLLDVLFLNRRGELADGAISTVFVATADGWFTPPLRSGALPGVLRGEILASGLATERVLYLDDLDRASAVFLGSALRGLRRVRVAAAPLVVAAALQAEAPRTEAADPGGPDSEGSVNGGAKNGAPRDDAR